MTYSKNSEKAANIIIIEDNDDDTNSDLAVHGQPQPRKKTQSKAWEDFDNSVKPILANENPRAAAIIELDKFLNDKLLKRDKDPLAWWEDKKTVYPKLFQIVQKRLCVPASSAPCERVFSKTGQLLTERRNRLKSKNVSQIIFLNYNL